MVDGGVAQRNAAELTLRQQGHFIPVVAVVKDDRHKPKDILGDSPYLRTHKLEILHANAEAHRFSLAFHRDRRSKSLTGTRTPRKRQS